MKRILCALLLFCMTATCHAGFITGYIVGSAMSDNSSEQPATSVLVTSDVEGHDTIACQMSDYKPGKCDTNVFPAEYAAAAGYTTVHKISVVISGEHSFFVIEVSK